MNCCCIALFPARFLRESYLKQLSDLSLVLCAPRNLSSVNEKTRQQMRETNGLVDSLVGYINTSLEESNAEDKVRQEEQYRH